MHKILPLFALMTFRLISISFAQEAVVIEVSGTVSYRTDTAAQWYPVKTNDLFQPSTQVKTASDGKCTIAFGYTRRNVVTIEENTEINIEKIIPGKIFLPKGRVFTLIKDLNKGDMFEVRTPTAVSGARGTGWVTEFVEGVTFIDVFEDNILVSGLDEKGNAVSEVEVTQDFHINVAEGGIQEDPEPVKPESKQEWHEQIKPIERYIVEETKRIDDGKKVDPVKQGVPLKPVEPGKPIDPGKPPVQGDLTQKMKEPGQRPGEEIRPFKGTPDRPAGENPNGPLPPGAPPPDNGFNQFFQNQFNPGAPPPPGENPPNPYFGEFDQAWNTPGGNFVNDPFHDNHNEQFNTIIDNNKICECPIDCRLRFYQCPGYVPPPPPP